MRSRYFWCITLFLLCHAQMQSQLLTNALPGSAEPAAAASRTVAQAGVSESPAQNPAQPPAQLPAQLPDDPGLQVLPTARPEAPPATGTPVRWEAREQTHAGDISTLNGEVVLYYKNYVLHADKIVYHHSTSTVEAEGHLQLQGGANDVVLTASHGEMHLDDKRAAFYDVTGSFGVRHMGKTVVYSTADPFIFRGRVLLQTGERSYRIVDGAMTACRLPKPDWQVISRAIEVKDGEASAHNSYFEFWRVPLFYLPFVKRNLDETGRQSGFLLPGGENSSVKGLVLGDEVYWAINRSMDITLGAQYWSKRGFAPSGSFRYRGSGLDAINVRWNALLDRGIEQVLAGDTKPTLVDQGGADIIAFGRKYFGPSTRVAGSVEYLSSYIYRLAFDENLAQATSSEVQSDLAFTHSRNGFVPSITMERFQTFAGTSEGNGAPVVNVPEARILHLPNIRYDVIDRPLGKGLFTQSPIYWGLGSSIGDMDRAEPHFHSRNVGRLDLYPHIEWPLHLGDWQVLPEFALRATEYSGSQIPDLEGTNFGGVPFVQHNALSRTDMEASLDIRPPAIERDFALNGSHRVLRHVIEPEIFYRHVNGIHNARDTLQFDTTDIATNTSEAGYSLTQRFYLRNTQAKPCEAQPESSASTSQTGDIATDQAAPNLDSLGRDDSVRSSITQHAADTGCVAPAREWASWQITQKFFIDPNFGGALIPDRRNVFTSTLDQTGVAYLVSPRNIAPVISRLRFDAVPNLRVEWDIDYDPKGGRIDADNLFAGYSIGRTTFGLGHALLNAVDEAGSSASVIQSQIVQPFIYFGKPSDVGLSVAMNASYDFTHDTLQYGGVEAVYNWNCCGLEAGYRRFQLGSLRDEGEWLWGFTLSSIGTAGNIHHSTSIFPTPAAMKLLY
ncbi:MAG TPA: LPS assembly protein LptD [Acidobacteriaceae bacterium]|nr:LPS assembly protein LptD [Acidobacteriaceae bacterium]